MASRIRGIRTRGIQPAFEQPETTYTFGNPQEELDRAGADSYRQGLAHALAMEQHRASQHYEQMNHDLAVSKIRSEAAQHQAKVEHQMKLDALMAQAIPELYSIDPADKDAHAKLAAVVKEYPQLGGYKDFMQHVGGYRGLIEGARKATEGEDFKSAIADQKSGYIDDRQALRLQHATELATQKQQHDKELLSQREVQAKELLAAREEARKARGVTDAQTKYEDAIALSHPEYGDLDSSGKFQPSEAGKTAQDHVRFSYQTPKGPITNQVMERKLFDEMVARSQDRAKSNTGASAFEQDAPTALVDTSASPIASGTATPTGEMDTSGSTNGTALPTALTPVADAPDAAANPIVDEPPAAPINPIIAPNTGAQVTTAETGAPVAVAEPHPFEGQRKWQKSTQQWGTFVNGVFVPES